MPKKYQPVSEPVEDMPLIPGGESRLSREGLRGFELKKHTVNSIWSHRQKRRRRTVLMEDGTTRSESIYKLVGWLIKSRGK